MGFSFIGLAVALGIFAPTLLLAAFPPREVPTGGVRDARWPWVLAERLGQAGCIILTVFSGGRFSLAQRPLWLVLMLFCIAVYVTLWARYLFKGRALGRLYRPLYILPVPMAVFPVLAFGFAALWGGYALLGAAALVPGVGHIGNSLYIIKALGQNNPL